MIKEAYGQCILSGTNLNIHDVNVPKEFELTINQNKGDLIKTGRYKGKHAVDGCLAFNGNFDAIVDFILLQKELDGLKNIMDINLSLIIEYHQQCNFELSADQIEKLSKLKVILGITCFPIEK